MATVADIFLRAEPIMRKKFGSATPASFTEALGFAWIKDAYDRIGRLCRIPRARSTSVTSTSGTRSYSLPSDCLGGFDGIITIEYLGYPLQKGFLEQLQNAYGENWLSPSSIDGTKVYFLEEDNTKFSVISTPNATGNAFTIIYVDEQAVPTATSTSIPTALNLYIPIIPLYLVGRAMEVDNKGRGAALISEFEARVKQEQALSSKQGRIVPGESIMSGFDNYKRRY